MDQKPLLIDVNLVRKLVATQFPQWKDLPIQPIALSGWDNRTFHLGQDMLVRLPSAAEYACQVEKEQKWLPKLAPLLPLPIPTPLAIGMPAGDYPWKWSIYLWLEGTAASSTSIRNLCECATSLAVFLSALQRIDSSEGPLPGPDNFYRGGGLIHYDGETRRAIASLKGKIDIDAALEVWTTALSTTWEKKPVWVHGDVSAGNLLVQDGGLSAVIDFGQLAVGDPACDLAINWTLFRDESRKIFRKTLLLDADTWARGRGWTLWKALIVAAGHTNPRNRESALCWHIIDDVIADYKCEK